MERDLEKIFENKKIYFEEEKDEALI